MASTNDGSFVLLEIISEEDIQNIQCFDFLRFFGRSVFGADGFVFVFRFVFRFYHTMQGHSLGNQRGLFFGGILHLSCWEEMGNWCYHAVALIRRVAVLNKG